MAELDLRSRRENPFLEPLFEKLSSLADFSRISVFQYLPDYLTVIMYRGPIPQAEALSLSFRPEQLGTEVAIREKRPTFWPEDALPADNQASHGYQKEWLLLNGAFPQSTLYVPILEGNAVLGLIEIGHQESGFFTPQLAQKINDLAHKHIPSLKKAIHYGEIRQQAAVAQMLFSVQKAVIARLEPDELLQLSVEKALQLLHAHTAVVLLAEGDSLVVAAHAGKPIPGLSVGDRCDSLHPLHSDLGEPNNLETLCSHEIPFLAGRQVLAAPLIAGKEIVGVLLVVEKRIGIFDHVDRRSLSCLVDSASIGLENGRLYHQARQIAILEERNRLSVELHDQFAQAMAYMQMHIALLKKRLQEGNLDQVAVKVDDLQRITAGTSALISEAIFDLRHAGGVEQDFLTTLETYLDKYGASYGIKTQLMLNTERRRFPAETELQLVRIVQEALTNARRHAQPCLVTVTLDRTREYACIQVQDNGNGFDVAATLKNRPGSRFGTRIMQERAESFGGRVEFDSRPGLGTTVKICIPIGEGE